MGTASTDGVGDLLAYLADGHDYTWADIGFDPYSPVDYGDLPSIRARYDEVMRALAVVTDKRSITAAFTRMARKRYETMYAKAFLASAEKTESGRRYRAQLVSQVEADNVALGEARCEQYKGMYTTLQKLADALNAALYTIRQEMKQL